MRIAASESDLDQPFERVRADGRGERSEVASGVAAGLAPLPPVHAAAAAEAGALDAPGPDRSPLPSLAEDHPAAALARARGAPKAAAYINAIAARVLAGDRDAAPALLFVDGVGRAIERCIAGTCALSPRAFHSKRCARFTVAAEAGSKSRLDTTEPLPSASVGWKPERDLAPAGAV